METVDFLKVCENQTRLGRKIYVPDYLSSGKYPIVDQSKKYIVAYTNEDDGLYSDVPFVIFGDVTRVMKYIDFPCFLGADGSVIVKVINPDFNTKYVYYALLNSYIPDTGFNRHYKFLKDIKIKKYTLNEQEKIVSILDKINEAIKLERKRLSLLDELIKSRFIELFANKNYSSIALKNLIIGKAQYGAGSASVPYEIGRPRYVRITDINDDGTLNENTVCSINKQDDLEYKLHYGDFLFARMGATVGKAYAFISGNEIYAGYLIRYKLDTNKLNPRYLFAFTKQEEYWEWVRSNQSGAAQPGINAKKYDGLMIPVPPINLQNEFADFVIQIDKSKFKVQNRIESLTELLNKKMDEFFGGDD